MTPLDSDRWASAAALFEDLLETGPAEREIRLRQLEDADPDLSRTVREMLSRDAGENRLLDQGLGGVAEVAVGGEGESGTLRPGTRPGDFEIVAEVGRGGMGVVYPHRLRPAA